ncbi:MAG: electron transfer flavoprotein subunit alpha/FixB family protein [Halobacteriota archaeon]
MVLALLEHDDGAVSDTSLEAISLARGIATSEDESFDAIAFGPQADGVAPDLESYGVDTVYTVEHEELTDYAPVAWAKSVMQLLEETEASAAVTSGTDRGGEVFAHVAALLDLPLAANVVEVNPGTTYELTRQRWGGSLKEHARMDAETNLITVVPHEVSAEPASEPGAAAVEPFTPSIDESDLVVQVERRKESDVEGVPIDQARVVVGGGRGVGGADDFEQLEELADLLNGAVGSSRAAVNEGWRPHDDQIGQTGNKIAPELYIPAGISGAVQHWVGCKGSEKVLAINTDPEAAIIQKADYAVVADLHEVVPEINRILRERLK